MSFDPKTGLPKGYLYFYVVPKSVSNQSSSFRMGAFHPNTKAFLGFGHPFTFESIKQDEMNQENKNEVNHAKTYLKLKEGDNLLAKLQTIQSEVFEDPGLVTEIYELTRKLNNNTMQNLQRNRILNTSRKTDSAKTEKFSCSFDNEEYKKETNSPIWSEAKKTPDSLYLSELYDDRKFQITAAFTNVMANYTLNNVDQFIRFIQAYKNQRNDKLEPFFNNYHVAFQKNVPHTPEDPVSLLIEINRRLSENQESAKGKLYIVSAYVNPSDNLIEDVKKSIQNTGLDFEKKAETELSKDQYQRHVAGVIKVKDGEREGIILLDPGYMNEEEQVYPYSAVLMKPKWETAELELNEVPVFGLKRDEIVDSYLGKKFALVSMKHRQCNGTGCEYKVLYLQYKPFCSFMDSTTKGNLLAPNYGIMSFDDKHVRPKGYLTFKVAPGNTTDKSPFFRVGPFDMYTGGYELKEFPFDSIKRDNTISQETIKKFDTIASYMSLKSGDTLLTKLQTIQSVVFENPKLVKEIDMLSTKLLNSKIKSTRQKLKNALSCFTGP
uniref:Uncharacterized protein n=1 Tax=Cacopsylla melanoneura TaxID=428564 RepID=A0A8D8U8X6_9HEMI